MCLSKHCDQKISSAVRSLFIFICFRNQSDGPWRRSVTRQINEKERNSRENDLDMLFRCPLARLTDRNASLGNA